MSSNGTREAAPQDETIELAKAFASARYLADLGGDRLMFGVGERVTEIETRLPSSHYAFVTAWNPDAESRSTVDNTRSDDRLVARLDAQGAQYRRVWAQDAEGGHREAGWLVAGLPPDRADALGREFEQAGILVWTAGEPVRLHMLMPAPAGAEVLEHVDWIE